MTWDDVVQGPVLRADAARNRDRVLRAARERVADGDRSLQFNVIARLAGVGVGTVYRHFPNRDALWEALSMERFQALVGEARTAAADEDALAGLHRLLRFTLARALEDGGFLKVLESPRANAARTSELKSELDDAVARLLDQAREAGAIRHDIEADDVRHLLCGTVHALHAGNGGGDAERVETYLAVLLEGLRPPR